MKFKIDFKFILILIIGAIVSISVYTFLGLDNVNVLVANQDIAPNTIVEESMLSSVQVDKNYMPSGYVLASQKASLVGGTLKYGLAAGNYVTTSQFYTQSELDMQKAADATNVYVMVPLTKEKAMNGELVRGDRINLVSSFALTNKELTTEVSKRVFTFLQNIKIQEVCYDDNDALSGIIILVSPTEAERVIYAISYGNGIYAVKTPINYVEQEIDYINELDFTGTTPGVGESGFVTPENGIKPIENNTEENVEENITE